MYARVVSDSAKCNSAVVFESENNCQELDKTTQILGNYCLLFQKI